MLLAMGMSAQEGDVGVEMVFLCSTSAAIVSIQYALPSENASLCNRDLHMLQVARNAEPPPDIGQS